MYQQSCGCEALSYMICFCTQTPPVYNWSPSWHSGLHLCLSFVVLDWSSALIIPCMSWRFSLRVWSEDNRIMAGQAVQQAGWQGKAFATSCDFTCGHWLVRYKVHCQVLFWCFLHFFQIFSSGNMFGLVKRFHYYRMWQHHKGNEFMICSACCVEMMKGVLFIYWKPKLIFFSLAH